jgi:membrane protein
VGSLVSAALWALGKELFGAVVTAAYARGTAAAVYGSLALVLLFLLWLWVTWLLVLFGLEITATIQALHGEGLEHLPAFGGHDDFVDVRWVLPLAAAVALSFRRGELPDTDQLAESVALPRRPVRRLLGALAEAGLLHRVEEKRRAGWSLARPPEGLPVLELIEAARPLLPRPAASSADAPALRLATAPPQGAEGMVLADLLPALSAES